MERRDLAPANPAWPDRGRDGALPSPICRSGRGAPYTGRFFANRPGKRLRPRRGGGGWDVASGGGARRGARAPPPPPPEARGATPHACPPPPAPDPPPPHPPPRPYGDEGPSPQKTYP